MIKSFFILVLLTGCSAQKDNCIPLDIKYGNKLTFNEGFYKDVEMIADGIDLNMVHLYIKESPQDKMWVYCFEVKKLNE